MPLPPKLKARLPLAQGPVLWLWEAPLCAAWPTCRLYLGYVPWISRTLDTGKGGQLFRNAHNIQWQVKTVREAVQNRQDDTPIQVPCQHKCPYIPSTLTSSFVTKHELKAYV